MHGSIISCGVVVFLLLASNTALTATSMYMIEKGKIIYVDDNNTEGPWDGSKNHPYNHIQDAVDNAKDGETVYVFNGVYNESVVVNKTLTLMGQNRTETIVDGMNLETVFCVTGERVVVKNFTIRNSGGYKGDSAIKINTDHNIVANCIIYRARTGVYINKTGCNLIKDCVFYTNGEAVLMESSSDDVVDGCLFSHNALGLHLRKTRNVSVSNIFVNNNGVGVYTEDSLNVNINHSAFYNNNDNQGGICVDESKHVIVEDCNIYHNGFGVELSHSSSVWINRCNLTWNTHFAVLANKQSHDVVLSRCNISNNFRFGIYVKENSYVTVHCSNVYGNLLYGVFCKNSCLDAQRNWWGSFVGPSFTEMGLGDRVTQKISLVRYFPWETKPFKEVGSSWGFNPWYGVYYVRDQPQHFRLEGTDSDDDIVPDWWEIKYGYDPFMWNDHAHLDPDNDGLNNIEECYTHGYGSNPFHRDLFLEFDWVARFPGDTENKPSSEYIKKMKTVFEQHNISLHVDDGSLGGGEEIPYVSNFSYADLKDLYWDYFLHNDLNNPRKGIFHYCLVCFYGPGAGFAFVGWDHLDSFDISAQMLQNRFGFLDRQRLIVGGAIHELGHTLGLFVDDHDGIDNSGVTKIFSLEWWRYRNYKSCMNYLYTFRLINYSDGSHGIGDFDDWNNLDFSFFKNSHFEWPK